MLHPHALTAQEEIDQLLGGERLLQYSDRPKLPYASAVFKEIVRWRPPTPLGLSWLPTPVQVIISLFHVGIPHRSIQDDIREGHFIPAGTTVIENVWWATFFVPGLPEPCLTMSDPHPLFSGPCRAMRAYTPTLRPSIRRDSSKAEVSTPTYKTLRSLCQVMEGGTFRALLPRHPFHSRTMSLRCLSPLPLVAFALESTLQSRCFSPRSLVRSPHLTSMRR